MFYLLKQPQTTTNPLISQELRPRHFMLIWNLWIFWSCCQVKDFHGQKQEWWTEIVQVAVKLKNKVLGLVEKYQEDG